MSDLFIEMLNEILDLQFLKSMIVGAITAGLVLFIIVSVVFIISLVFILIDYFQGKHL